MKPSSSTRRRLLQGALATATMPLLNAREPRMRRVFITGSTDGLGRGAALELLRQGHEVVLHARSAERAKVLSDLASRAAGVVIGDLASAAETRDLAAQVNKLGRMDAVIHNAGVFRESARGNTPEGHARVLAVNVLAPYMLTGLIQRPDRLVYLSSSMHRGGEGPLDDIDWSTRKWDVFRAYSESKLYVTALAFAIARRWPNVASNAVDPGWVPTKMGGRSAPENLEQGHLTQTWLAVSDDEQARTSGHLWKHRVREAPAPQSLDVAFQDQLITRLAAITGTELP
jgi:NAD(P)-dependent dehydrogenase (short-subunit alcohol dehydrogenase family)